MSQLLIAACPHCDKRYRVPEDQLGQRARCRQCRRSFIVVALEGSIGIPPTLRPLTSVTSGTQGSQAADSYKLSQGASADLEPPSSLGLQHSAGSSATPLSGVRSIAFQTDTGGSRSQRSSGFSRVSGSTTRSIKIQLDEDAVPQDWHVGDRILDLYEVIRVLGAGAMGRVYQVRHLGWNVDLAVKSPKPEVLSRSGGAENFEQEAEVWVNLGLHPHTVSCYYVRRLGGIPRVFAEYVRGGSLQTWIRSGQFQDLAQMLDIAIQFAWGLQHAHHHKLIHQDVKPENVMMTPEGIAKVTDFGLARARALGSGDFKTLGADEEQGTLLATFGGMTRGYCSPEQAQGLEMARAGIPRDQRPKLTRETDVWSWGVSVLEMFVGTITWRSGIEALDALEDYQEQGPQRDGIPKMPADLEDLLRHCFEADPDRRPQSMTEIAERLERIYADVTDLSYPRPRPTVEQSLADSLNNRAVSLLDLGNRRQALRLWDEALQIDPQHMESIYNQGLVQWRTGEITDEALIEILLQKQREIRSSQPEAWLPTYLLAQVHLERRDYAEAITLLNGLVGLGVTEVETNALLSEDPTAAALEALEPLPEILIPSQEQEEIIITLTMAEEELPLTQKLLFNLEGHTSPVLAVHMDPEQRYGFSGSEDGMLLLWDLKTGSCIRSWLGHADAVWAVYLSPDGDLGLSGSRDGSIKLWDLRKGQCLQTLMGHRNGIHSLMVTPDGQFLLSGGYDNQLYLWDLNQGDLLLTLTGHCWAAAQLSQSGRYLVSAGYKSLRIWDLGVHAHTEGPITVDDLIASWHPLRTFEQNRTSYSLSLTYRGDRVLLASGHPGIAPNLGTDPELIDLNSGKRLRRLKGHRLGVEAVQITTNGSHAVTGSRDGTIKLWDLQTGRCLRTFSDHGGAVHTLCWSEDQHYLISGGEDRTVKVWLLQDSEVAVKAPFMVCRIQASETALSTETAYQAALYQARQAFGHGDPATAAEQIRVARSQPGCQRRVDAMQVWMDLYVCLPRGSLMGGWEGQVFTGHQRYVTAISCNHDGRWILSASEDKTLKLWDVKTGSELKSLTGHGAVVTCVCFSQDGRRALSGGEDNTLRVWDLDQGRCLQTLEGHTAYVTSVVMSQDGHYALSGSYHDRSLRLWDLQAGSCLHTFSGLKTGVTGIQLSKDERRLLTSGHQILQLWDLATGQSIHDFEGVRDTVRSVSLSPDGRYALTGSYDATLQLWDLETGTCLRTFEGHTSWINSVALSADGHYALSGSHDQTVKLWDLRSGQCLRTFEGHQAAVNSVEFSPDSRYAISGGRDRLIKLWTLDWELLPIPEQDWDPGAEPYLRNFLGRQQPSMTRWIGSSSTSQLPPESTSVTWDPEAFEQLLYRLGCAGYGWIRPEIVHQHLARLSGTAANNLPSPSSDPSFA